MYTSPSDPAIVIKRIHTFRNRYNEHRRYKYAPPSRLSRRTFYIEPHFSIYNLRFIFAWWIIIVVVVVVRPIRLFMYANGLYRVWPAYGFVNGRRQTLNIIIIIICKTRCRVSFTRRNKFVSADPTRAYYNLTTQTGERYASPGVLYSWESRRRRRRRVIYNIYGRRNVYLPPLSRRILRIDLAHYSPIFIVLLFRNTMNSRVLIRPFAGAGISLRPAACQTRNDRFPAPGSRV